MQTPHTEAVKFTRQYVINPLFVPPLMVLVYMSIIPFSTLLSILPPYIHLRSYSNLSMVCPVFGYSWHFCAYCTIWISSCSTDMVLRSWGSYYLPPPSQSLLYIPCSLPSQSFRITGQLITPNMSTYYACTMHVFHTSTLCYRTLLYIRAAS